MNKLIILLLAVCCFFACKDETTENDIFIPTLELSQDTLLLDSAMTSTKITVTTNGEYWEVEVPEEIDWVEYSTNNVPGATYLVLKVAQNKGAVERTARVKVLGQDIEKTILVKQMGSEPVIMTSAENFSIKDDTATLKLYVRSNLEFTIQIPDTTTWMQSLGRDAQDTTLYTFGVNPNGYEDRSGVIILQAQGHDLKKIIPVQQTGRKEYKPGNSASVEGLVKLNVIKASDYCVTSPGGCHQDGSVDAAKTIDGDLNTMYHSTWAHTKDEDYPVTLEYEFDETSKFLDYIVCTPRNGNGAFKTGEVWYKTSDYSKYTKLCDFDEEGRGKPFTIKFPDGIENPRGVKFVLGPGKNGNIACLEMEFFYMGRLDTSLDAIFTDHSYSELKPGVTYEQIAGIENKFYANIAKYLYHNEYPMFRIMECEPYQLPSTIQKEYKISPYSELDNATGIFVKNGEELLIFVGEMHGENVGLSVVDFNKGYSKTDYSLVEGVNRIEMKGEGLVYIMYNTDNYKTAAPVKVHIASGGTFNGYFDVAKHTDADWNRILQATVTNHLDVLGHKMHLVFPVEAYRSYVPSPTALMGTWDEIVALEHRLMGLERYSKPIKNRLLGHVIYQKNEPDAYMYATSYRTAYIEYTMSKICDVSQMRKVNQNAQGDDVIWGPAHEIGHVHQTRPGLKWIGTTEVTNNIHSLFVQTTWGSRSRLDRGGYYQKAFNNIVVGGIPHGAETDPFCKSVPFWQMFLYSKKVSDNPYLYEDLHEQVRNEVDPVENKNGVCQLNFVERCCDIMQLDFTDYFKAWGLLKEVDLEIDDYAKEKLTCTAEEVAAADARIKAKGYAKAPAGLIYITDGTAVIFKNKAAIVAGNSAINGDKVTLSDWKNVVAYEVYSGGELKMAVPAVAPEISSATSFTIKSGISAPEVKAVSWDGQRINVTF